MAQDRTALIHRVLRNLGVLPQGQSPSAEELQSIDDLIDPTIQNLRIRNIAKIDDADNIEDEFFIPLAHCVTATAAPEFGQINQVIIALKERAELDPKYMYDQLYRNPPHNMRTDYPFAVTCRSTWSFTNG